MSSRDNILGAIRQSLGRPELTTDAKRALNQRIIRHPTNLIPARAKGERSRLIKQFQDMARVAACSVENVTDMATVPAAVSEFLRANNLPAQVILATDGWLDRLNWDGDNLLQTRTGPAEISDMVSVTPAFAGVAETGTIVAFSGNGHPTTLNFVPDFHVVVLCHSQVVGAYEEVWDRLRSEKKQGRGFVMPRTINMITGPSRTADIALTIELGAHGPRSLHIILVDDEDG